MPKRILQERICIGPPASFLPDVCPTEKRDNFERGSTRTGLFSLTMSEKRERRKDLERGVEIKFSKLEIYASKIVTAKILN